MNKPLLDSSRCWCCGTDLLVLGLAMCLECEQVFISVIRQEAAGAELPLPLPYAPEHTWA